MEVKPHWVNSKQLGPFLASGRAQRRLGPLVSECRTPAQGCEESPPGAWEVLLCGKTACCTCPSFVGRHLWNDCTPLKASFYIIQDCPGSLSSERKKSHMNYLQGTKLFPFMSSNFVFVSANWDFVYPWIVFPGAWKIWLFNYEWGFFVWVRVN